MKNFNIRLLFLISSYLLSSAHVFSQTSFRDKIRTVFQNVDKTQASTQYIKECGYPFLYMDDFNTDITDTSILDLANSQRNSLNQKSK